MFSKKPEDEREQMQSEIGCEFVLPEPYEAEQHLLCGQNYLHVCKMTEDVDIKRFGIAHNSFVPYSLRF